MRTVILVFLLTFISYAVTEDDTITTSLKSNTICNVCKCLNGPQFVLDCRLQSLKKIPTEWPDQNKSLTVTLSFNNITTLEVLPKSDHLRDLILDNCGIVNIENDAFINVKNLRFLDLSHNLLTTEELSANIFKGPYNNSVYAPLPIKHLNLAYNKLHSIPHKVFEHLTRLEELILEGNEFRVLDLPTQIVLSGLQNLQRLDLSHNKLTELPPEAISKLSTLVEIDLSDNLFDFVPDTLNLLGKTLESVNLDGNLIFEITDESFLGVKNLIEISLTNLSRLQYINANSFAGLPNLKILKLSDNSDLFGIDKEAFSSNQSLEELWLHNNSLKGLDISLTNWATLRILTLNDNPLVCNCDLYEIVNNLQWEVRRTRDGPICMNPMSGKSQQVYSLHKEICGYKDNSFGVHIIESHFETIRIVLLTVSVSLCFTAGIVVTILFLRYRRYKMNKNYPFATQVMYNPLRMPNIPI